MPEFRKKSDIFVQSNEGAFDRGYVIGERQLDDTFFQVSDSKDGFESIDTTNPRVASIFIRVDEISINYSRTTYTLIDALAKVGGFFRIVSGVFQVSLLLFVENLFFASVMSKIYQVDDQHERVYLTDSSNYESDPNHPESNHSLQIKDEHQFGEPPRKSISNNKVEDSKEIDKEGGDADGKGIHPCKRFHDQNETIAKNLQDVAENGTGRHKVVELAYRLKNMVFSRKMFRYGHCDVFHYFLCCALCRSERSLRRNKSLRKHRVYDIGEHKLKKELDCVNLVSKHLLPKLDDL